MHCVAPPAPCPASTGYSSQKFGTRGYHLCETHNCVQGSQNIYSFQPCFCLDGLNPGAAQCLPVLGQVINSGNMVHTVGISKRVKTVTFNRDGQSQKGIDGIWLTFKDGTTQATVAGSAINTTPTFTFNLCGTFLGLGMNFEKDNQNKVDNTIAAEVYEDYPVNYYNLISYIQDFIYLLNDPQVMKQWDSTNVGCYTETITITYLKNGVAASKPLGLTENKTWSTTPTPHFLLNASSPNDVGIWTVTVSGSMSSDTGGPYTDSFSFQMTIKSDCEATPTIIDSPTPITISNMSHTIAGTASTQVPSPMNSVANTRLNPSYCGPYTYTFQQSYPWLSIQSGTTIQVLSSDPAAVTGSPFTIHLVMALTNFPTVASVTKTFTVTLTCVVSTLTFSTVPTSSTTVEIGIDAQPFYIPALPTKWQLTRNPNCNNAPVITLTITPPKACITTVNDVGNMSGSIQVNGCTLADIGTYACTLTAVVDSKTATNSFTVILQDPCKRAIFDAVNPFTLMTVTMPSAGPTTQAPAVKTDLSPGITCNWTGVISPVAAYISYSNVSKTVTVAHGSIVLPTDLGNHSFQITVDSALWGANVTDKVYTFDVFITCTVATLTVTQQADNKDPYVLNQGAYTNVKSLEVTQTQACGWSYTYSHACKKNTIVISCPSWLVWSDTTRKYTATVTAVADIGSYEITTTISIPTPMSTSATWTLNVVSDCTIAILTDKTISDITYGVTLAASNTNVFFLDNISTGHSDNTYCGPRKYTLTPSTHTWLSIASDNMKVETSNLNDVGVYPGIQLKIELQNYPMVTPIIKTFKVTITCTVTTLSFTTSPLTTISDKTIEVAIDPQPQNMVFSITKDPNCVQDPVFTLTPSLAFVTETTNADGESGTISVHDATLLHQSINNMAFTASLDGRTATKNFVVTIKDPCKRAIFETTPNPMSLMTIVMPSVASTDQTVKIWTDVERIDSVACPITATLAPSKLFMTLASNFSKVTVNASQILLPTDVGIHTFTLTVNELNWSASVTQKTYSFDVRIECDVTALNVDQKASDKNYILNEGTHVTLALLVSQTSACNYPYTYTHAVKKNTVSITQPSWLTFDNTTKKYSATVTDPLDVGVYEITTTTTIPANPLTGALNSITSTFTLTVVSDCTITSFETLGLADMSQGVNVPVKTQNIFYTDTISTGHGQPNYCGTRTYVLSPDTLAFPFIYIDGDNVKVHTTDESWIGGPYSFTITATLTSYGMVASHQETFVVMITCGVQSHSWVLPEVPAYTMLQIGIDTLPWVVNFATSQFPNCGNQVAFTITAPGTTPFMTLETLGIETGRITVNNANIGHHGHYLCSLIGEVDTLRVQTDFEIFIKDPCSTSIFELSPAPLIDMQVLMYYMTTETQVQNVKIWTDVERTYSSIICPITAVLTPSLPYISLSADFKTINVDASFASDLDVGLHPMTLTVSNPTFPSPQVADAVYSFVLDLKACEVADFVFVNPVTSFTYMLTDPQVITQPVLATENNINCLFPITYATTYKRGVVAIPEPTYFFRDIGTNEFKLHTNMKVDIGLYTVEVSASIPQVLLVGGIKTITFTFDVTIESDCKISVIDDRAINYMETLLGVDLTQDSTFTNTRASWHNDLLHCGDYNFVLSPVYPFLNVLNTAGTYTLDLFSTTVADCNLYSITLTVSLPEFPVIVPVVKTFDVKLICNILSIEANPAPALSYKYTIQVSTTIYIPYKFTPTPSCQMDVSITPDPNSYAWILGPFAIADNLILIQTRNMLHEGIYSFKFDAYPTPAISVGATKSVSFQIELINACRTTSFVGKVTSLEILRQKPEFKIDNFIDISSMRTLAEEMGVDCGPTVYSLSNQNLQIPDLPLWIRLENDAKRMVVNLSQEATMSFSWMFLLGMQLTKYPQIAYQTKFNVTLSSAGFECLANPETKIYTGDPDYTFEVQYGNNTQIKNIKLTQIADPYILDEKQQQLSLPSFAKFNQARLGYTLQKPKFEQLGVYQFGITIGYKEFAGSEIHCLKKVEIEYKTRFSGDIPSSLVIPCEQPYTYILPPYLDVFDKAAQVTMVMNEVKDFMQFDQASNSLNSFTKTDDFCKYAGKTYEIVMTLTDSVKGKLDYRFSVTVTNLNKVMKPDHVGEFQIKGFEMPPPKPVIKFVDQKGYVRVIFTRPIQIPTYDRYPEFREDERMRQNCTNGEVLACTEALEKAKENQAQGTSRQLQSTNKQDQELREALEITNRGMVRINNTMQPIIQLDMLPGSDETDETIIKQFNWEVVDFKQEYMDFQLTYEQFPQVSVHDAADLLKVNFIGRQYFKAPDGQYFQEAVTVQQKQVPMQVDPVYGQKMENLGNTAANLGLAAGIGNVFLNFLLGGILHEMFSVLNKLQIMLHMMIANVDVPAHTMLFMRGLMSLVTFQVYKFDNILIRMFGLSKEEELVIDHLHYLGYTSMYFVVNMGNVLTLLMFFLALVVFTLISRWCKNPRMVKISEHAKVILKWNGIYRLMNEPYVIYAVSCLTQMLSMNWRSHGEKLNNVLMILMFVLVVVFPFWVFFFIRKNRYNLGKNSFKQKYGTIYEHLKLKQGNYWILAEPAIFPARMLLTLIMMIYLQKWRYFQLMVAMYIHYAVLIYNGQVQPFNDKQYAFFQQFNETFVFWTIVLMFTFADWTMNKYAHDTMGNLLIALLVLNLAINMIFLCIRAVLKNLFKYKVLYLLWKRKKHTKSIEKKKVLWEQERLAALAIANDKAPLSPKSLRVWHRLRKDLGMSYDAQMLDLSNEVSFNSEAHLVEIKKELAQNPANQLILSNPASIDDALQKSQLRVEEEAKQEFDEFGYAISAEAKQKMDLYYNDEKQFGRTFDNGATHYGTSGFIGTQLRPQPIQRHNFNSTFNKGDASPDYEIHKANQLIVNYDNQGAQNENNKVQSFNDMFTNYLMMRNDENFENDQWGQQAHTLVDGTIRHRDSAQTQLQPMNVMEHYVQPGVDLDDEAAHARRVQKRRENVNKGLGSTTQARELFDNLWKNNDNSSSRNANEHLSQTGIVQVKTLKGNQPISIVPARFRGQKQDNWGNPM